jgi:hypothetical protein
VGTKLKFGYPVLRIKEEIFDWRYAKRRGWKLLVKRSKRQLRDWVEKGEQRLKRKDGTDEQHAVLWVHTTLGRELLSGRMRLERGWDIAGRGNKKKVTPAMEAFTLSLAMAYELEQARKSDQYLDFLENLEQLQAVPLAFTRDLSPAARLEIGRRIAALLSSELYRMLRGASGPPPGVTDRQWASWDAAAEAAVATLAKAKQTPGWARVALIEQAHRAAPAEPIDRASELREALLWAREQPGIRTFDRLQRALVYTAGDPSLAAEVAESHDVLRLTPRPTLTALVADMVVVEPPWYVRYRYPLAGAAIAATAGMMILTVKAKRRRE